MLCSLGKLAATIPTTNLSTVLWHTIAALLAHVLADHIRRDATDYGAAGFPLLTLWLMGTAFTVCELPKCVMVIGMRTLSCPLSRVGGQPGGFSNRLHSDAAGGLPYGRMGGRPSRQHPMVCAKAVADIGRTARTVRYDSHPRPRYYGSAHSEATIMFCSVFLIYSFSFAFYFILRPKFV
jgi:hypothetical protein